MEEKELEKQKEESGDTLAGYLNILGVLEIIAGVIIAIKLLPGEPPEGRHWLFIKYIPSLVWWVGSIISALFLFVFARILNYLKEISKNTKEKKG